MSKEFPSFGPKSEFTQRLEKKEAEGWVILGEERLTIVKFSQEAKFEQIPLQTEADIISKYRSNLAKQAPGVDFEIELLLNENSADFLKLKEILTPEEYKNALITINPEKKQYIVLAKKK
jgi:hypothetical protein